MNKNSRAWLFKQGKTGTPYHFIGWIGFLFGVALNFFLANQFDLSLWTVAGYSSLTIITFYGYAMISKIIKGYEDIIYYRHEIVVLTVTGIFLKLTGKPVAVYLDLYILGLGLFLVFGRMGCFLSGCCFGRPHRCGIKPNMQRGYPPYLSGITIIPTQLIESGMVLLIVISGIAMIWNDHQPGETLAWYTIVYGTGRFTLEYFRGDKRPYLIGLSEAQWTTLILVAVVIIAGDRGLLAVEPWQYRTAVILAVLAMLTVMFRFIYPDHYRLFHPHHISELIKIIKKISNQEKGANVNDLSDVETYTTSAGLILSGGPLPDSRSYHLTLSGATNPVSKSQAKHIFLLIRRLQDDRESNYEIHENNGVYHMVTSPSS